eukprot:5632744-Pyramimonas_sp.AAC.1
MATTQNLELEVRRPEQVLAKVHDEEGGSLVRKKRVVKLQDAGEESRAEIQRANLQRSLDAQQTEIALTKQCIEAEDGFVHVQRHAERLEHKACHPQTASPAD